MGPLIDQGAVSDYSNALIKAKEQGCEILYGGNVINDKKDFMLSQQ